MFLYIVNHRDVHYSDNLPYAFCEQIGKEIRDISDEIPFDIPDTWEWARCSTIGAIIRGSGIKRTETVESGMPCVRYGELYTTYNTSFTKTVSFVPQELFEQCKQIKYGDVLFTLTGENKPDIAKTVVYSTSFTVNQEINGKIGSGGIYGYYCPAFTNSAAALSYDDINVACILKGAGGSGGLFGVLYNNNGSITISDGTGDADHVTVNNAGATTNYGGLIGSYSAASLDDTLTISSGCTSKPSQDGGSSSAYGGAIGAVASASYVRLNGFSTTAAGAANFGGAVGNADGAFIDVNGLTVSANEFTGGGVVNALGNGVLRMQGTIDLSGAKSKSGQIVNTRNAGFVFAEAGWVLKRSTSAAGVDDIASWGEVVRFQSSGLTKASVLTHSDGDHYVTLLDAVKTMSSASDFARTALNIQHNNNTITDTSAVLRFTTPNTSSTLLSSNLLYA